MEQESPERGVLPSEQERGLKKGRVYTMRERKAPIRFTINLCVRLHDNHEPLIKDALKESELPQQKAAVKKEISAVENIQCWTLASRRSDRNTLHSKFVLRIKKASEVKW